MILQKSKKKYYLIIFKKNFFKVNCAPWKTTKAYLNAMKGECILDRTGIADPTGCNLGFSFVRVSRNFKQKVLF